MRVVLGVARVVLGVVRVVLGVVRDVRGVVRVLWGLYRVVVSFFVLMGFKWGLGYSRGRFLIDITVWTFCMDLPNEHILRI